MICPGEPLGDERPFERGVKERRLDESACNPDMDNYTSAELSGDQLEAHFRKEEALGRMIPSSEAAKLRSSDRTSCWSVRWERSDRPAHEVIVREGEGKRLPLCVRVLPADLA